MSDHDTLPPEADDELRARLRALGGEVAEHADTEAALGIVAQRRRRPSTVGWLAIAACVLLVVVLASVLLPQREGVDTTDPADAPTTDCSSTTQALNINPGGQMRTRFALPVAGAATAIMLIGACSDDDGPTTIAEGEDIDFVGEDGLGGQTLDISAVDDDGEVTGEIRFNEEVVTVQCADTDDDGVVVLGGEVTTAPPDDSDDVRGQHVALIIREGDPDRVALYSDDAAGSCDEILDSVTEDVLADESIYVDVEDGEDIATG